MQPLGSCRDAAQNSTILNQNEYLLWRALASLDSWAGGFSAVCPHFGHAPLKFLWRIRADMCKP
jgi:hypothetical protein